MLTVVVVPRERFSFAVEQLRRVYETADVPFRLVYVDGNSPPYVQRALEAQARARGFELLRSDRFLTPNQARNLGLSRVVTEYAVVIDNDCAPHAGWLSKLLACALETGADVIGPLYHLREPEAGVLHMAGGHLSRRVVNGRKILFETHRWGDAPAASVDRPLVREPIDLVEWHCLLLRMHIWRRLGGLDESLLNTREHVDFCMSVRDAGGSVWFEPEAHVSYMIPPPLETGDLPYYWLRWSEDWTERSLAYFNHKWDITHDPEHMNWTRAHRRLWLHGLDERVLGKLYRINRAWGLWAKRKLRQAEDGFNRLVVRTLMRCYLRRSRGTPILTGATRLVRRRDAA
ncbi:MAG: glycosyltransferase family 2 protein [Tepidisphaeraceae bacterium]